MAIQTSSKPGKVVGYCRVSTTRQARTGQSLSAQRGRIRAYAKAHGLTVQRFYVDGGVSAKCTDRPALSELRSDLDDTSVVIVHKFDRISRSVVDLYMLLREFDNAEVEFRSVCEGADTGSAVGRFMMTIFASLAQMERELIAERTRETLSHKRSKGEHCGRVPFGWRVAEDGHLERSPDQQKAIARMRRLRRSGHSIRDISGRIGLPKSTVHKVISQRHR